MSLWFSLKPGSNEVPAHLLSMCRSWNLQTLMVLTFGGRFVCSQIKHNMLLPLGWLISGVGKKPKSFLGMLECWNIPWSKVWHYKQCLLLCFQCTFLCALLQLSGFGMGHYLVWIEPPSEVCWVTSSLVIVSVYILKPGFNLVCGNTCHFCCCLSLSVWGNMQSEIFLHFGFWFSCLMDFICCREWLWLGIIMYNKWGIMLSLTL